jgi:hypothetical protein
MKLYSNPCRLTFVLAMLSGLIFPGAANAVPDRDRDYVQKPKLPVRWSQTFLPFEKRGEPWDQVLRWFAKETGMRFVSYYPIPAGTFTFINPRVDGIPKQYSLVEVYDIINEILLGATKHGLLRVEDKLVLIPLDASIWDWPPLPRIRLQDLPERGRTEVVIIELKIKPDDIPQMRRWGGDFGHITPLENGRCLVRMPVANLAILNEIRVLEE